MRKPRPVQQGTAKVDVAVAGGEAALFDIVVGNTHPESTEDIVKNVLQQVSQAVDGEAKLDEPLNILEVECLTKPREDGRRIWSKTWRIQVANKFKSYMMRPEAYPTGWTSRRYFPPRPQRPPVADLNPTSSQPPEKRPNLFLQAQH